MRFDQYAFVLNLYKYEGSLPIAISDTVELDFSTLDQSQRIQELLGYYGHTPRSGSWLYTVEPVDEVPIGSHFFTPIPPDRVKFWVLNFSGDAMPIWRLSSATQLTNAQLEIAATFNPAQGNSINQLEPARLFHFWEQHRQPVSQPLNAGDLHSAVAYRDTMESLAASNEEAAQAIVRVYSDFVRLSMGPRSGELVLLGHFGLIEALITHNPNEFGDSLNHQLSTKMPLLMRRFGVPLQLSEYFSITDPNRAWKKLYSIRSKIAHGEGVDIRPGALKELRDIDTVFKFVREALKRLLIYAIDDPEFIFDLKKC
jgi:hypothetical protein